MAALTQDRNTASREGQSFSLGVAAGEKIYAGSIVAMDSNGYAVPASDTAGLKVIGRAEEQVDNSSGSDGDENLLVREGVFRYSGSGLDIGDIGKPCFVSDDQTVSVSATTNNICAGIIEQIDSSTGAWVRIGLAERAGAPQADSAAADVATLKSDFNSLLARLRAARLIAS